MIILTIDQFHSLEVVCLKNLCTRLLFFACFWAHVRQPHDHISWATPMPFPSINSINPKTNPWNFHEKILRIGGAGKWPFLGGHFDFFFKKKKLKKNCIISMKTSSPFISGIIYFCNMDGFFRILEKTSSELKPYLSAH